MTNLTVYYAVAGVTKHDRYGILGVTRRPRLATDPASHVPTVLVSQEWTGEEFRTWDAATKRMNELNRQLFEPAGSDVTGSTLGASHSVSTRDVASQTSYETRKSFQGASGADSGSGIAAPLAGGSR